MTSPNDGFAIHADAMLKAVTPRTRGIIVNSPCNPTGALIAEGEFRKIAEFAGKNDIWLVVDLLVAMGYGGSQRDAGRAVGPGADEGIDGVIKEDRLGLETIYIQAKRWRGTLRKTQRVGRDFSKPLPNYPQRPGMGQSHCYRHGNAAERRLAPGGGSVLDFRTSLLSPEFGW